MKINHFYGKMLKCFIGFVFTIFLMLPNSKLDAAVKFERSIAFDDPIVINNITFTAEEYVDGDNYYYRIIMKKNGKSSVIADHAGCTFVTDGKVVYYVYCYSDESYYPSIGTIYKYDLATKKRKKIVAGNHVLVGCSGRYLYYGPYRDTEGVELYALDLNTKKKKFVDCYVAFVEILKDRIIPVYMMGTDVFEEYYYDGPILSYKLDGSGKKEIATGTPISVKNSLLYYVVCKLEEKALEDLDAYEKAEIVAGYDAYFKIYTCTATGKNKKAITGWMSSYAEYCAKCAELGLW